MDSPGADTPAQRGPLPAFRAMVAAGDLAPDPSQELVAQRLQALWTRLRGYDPPPRPANGHSLFSRLLRRSAPVEDQPNGLYITGEVGRGKSMLMDLFFAATPVRRKQRIHFHRFMQTVHARFHALKRTNPDIDDPIPPLADQIAADAALLCFDEFQVNDIADAMIIERLFRALFEAGTVVVATSNRPPDRLYEHGLQRDRFLPFIVLLEQRLDRVELDSGRDYRLSRMMGKRVYHWPLDTAARQALEAAFAELTEGAPETSETLIVQKRPLTVPRAAHNIAWFSFEELCDRPLAAADYLAIAERFAAVILDGIPCLDAARRNEAQRFHILIDALYEARTLLIASAAVPPDEIYPSGDGAWEFRRTVSRLHEMQSEDYLANRTKG
jgi:cell division protein ZapE